jgi:hypothetical protein
MSGMEKCTRCGDPLDAQTRAHWENEPLDPTGTGFGHKDLCCDCHNLSCGMPVDMVPIPVSIAESGVVETHSVSRANHLAGEAIRLDSSLSAEDVRIELGRFSRQRGFRDRRGSSATSPSKTQRV